MANISPDAAPPLDAPRAGGDVHCPLCEYNLRGLAEPCCPECGYRFEWIDLTDPARRRHPYLFEHHPERNAWSFTRTLLAGLRPGRFWASIHPAQPSRAGRLLTYWMGCCLVLAVAYAAHAALWVKQTRAAERATLARWIATYYGPGSPHREQVVRRYESFEAFVAQVTRDDRQPWTLGARWATRMVVVFLLWPWLVLLALLVFRASMRRARIRAVHMLRCVLYSYDVVLWIGVAVAAAVCVKFLAPLGLLPRHWQYPGALIPPAPIPDDHVFQYEAHLVTDALFWSACLLLVLAAYRLASALRHYLRFDHAAATVVAAHAVAGLLLTVAVVRAWLI